MEEISDVSAQDFNHQFEFYYSSVSEFNVHISSQKYFCFTCFWCNFEAALFLLKVKPGRDKWTWTKGERRSEESPVFVLFNPRLRWFLLQRLSVFLSRIKVACDLLNSFVGNNNCQDVSLNLSLPPLMCLPIQDQSSVSLPSAFLPPNTPSGGLTSGGDSASGDGGPSIRARSLPDQRRELTSH